MKSIAPAGRDRHEVDAGHGGEGLVVGVVRLHDDDVVPLVRAGQKSKQNRFAAAGRSQDLVVLELQSQSALVVALQAADELRRAGGWGVLQDLVLELLEP